MTDLLTYDQALAEVRRFIPAGTRGRYRFEELGWSRWLTRPKISPRVRSAMMAMAVGHPWLEVQREKDKDYVSVEKVSETPP